MILVVDAGVALKWFLYVGDSEPDRNCALTLLTAVDDESVQLVQPAHFIAEVAALQARARVSAIVQAPDYALHHRPPARSVAWLAGMVRRLSQAA